MGTWGTGIYSNDTAQDVISICNEIFSFYTSEEGNKKIFEIFEDVLNQDWIDDDYASFWYALADWQWKHGMLLDQVKVKTLELLEFYAGIDDWIELGNNSDVKKRYKALDGLKKRLMDTQPAMNKPKLKLAKPKHKVGDIIVFQAPVNNDEISYWKMETFTVPLIFRSKKIFNSQHENIKGCDARGKYMALLCVGTEKEQYSQYITNVYNERSVYVWYDYFSEKEPTAEILSSCGFLPFIEREWEDFNRSITKHVEWVYRFVLESESFRVCDEIFKIKKYTILDEVVRFEKLFSQKKYSTYSYGGMNLPLMFRVVFEEKFRMNLLGESVDNLLDVSTENPLLLSPSEIDKACAEYIKSLSIEQEQANYKNNPK